MSEEIAERVHATSRHVYLKRKAAVAETLAVTRPVIVVMDGLLGIQNMLPDGRRVIAAVFAPGDVCDLRRPNLRDGWRLVCLKKGEVCALSATTLDEVMSEDPALGLKMATELRDRIHASYDHAIDLARKTPDERIASFVLEACGFGGGEVEGDNHSVELGLNRTDIADYMGLQSETVSRVFKRLENDGVLRLDSRQTVQIQNLAALRRLAHGGQPDASGNHRRNGARAGH